MKTQNKTQTATVKEMRTLINSAKKYADDTAKRADRLATAAKTAENHAAACKKYTDDTGLHWQQVHALTAAAHSAANRAERHARAAKRCLLLDILATIIIATLTTILYLQK